MSFTKRTGLMQYQLLELALTEVGIDNTNIFVNHVDGTVKVNDIILDLKYPHSFISAIDSLSTNKIYNYCFKGTTTFKSASLHRSTILEKFDTPDNAIISTSVGMSRKNKKVFDVSYYQLLSNSKYSLCPNWGGKHWDHQYAWTYRFIESAFCKTIPIVFDETPLGTNNTKDITYFSNNNLPDLSDSEYTEIVEKNYVNAVKHWTLQDTEIEQIKMNS